MKELKKKSGIIVKNKRRIVIISISLLSFGTIFSLFSTNVEADWMDDRWAFRKHITVSNNTTSQNNVYISFDAGDVLDTSSSSFQGDCGDIRFTKNNGELLKYRVLSGCGTSSTDIDVLYDTFPAGVNSLYMYYGNPGAENGFELSAFATEASNYTIGTVGVEETGPGPVSYWNLDEMASDTCPGGSNDICDSAQGRNDGTLSGAEWNSNDLCLLDGCLFFDGIDDVGTITNVTSIDFDDRLNNGFSFGAWVRVMSDGENNVGEILNKGNSYIRIDNEGVDGLADVEFNLDLTTTDANVNVSDGISMGNWHYIQVTHNGGSSISIYIDGALRGQNTGSGTMSVDTSNLLIGGGTTANFNGFIDEVRLYDYERTAAQVKADYIRGAGINGSAAVFGAKDTSFLNNGLVGYWMVDESSGDIADSSGNGYALTNNSTVAFIEGKFGNGSEHVPASSEYFSTATTINGINSVSFWTNPDSTTNYYLSLTSGAYITSSGGTLAATGLANSVIYVDGEESVSIAADSWQHVVVTFDSIDASQLYVGRQGSNYYDGTLDEIRLYNRVLSPREINSLYNWAPGPIGYWNFDENTGTSSIYDRSGNSNTGTMIAMEESDWVPGVYGSALFVGNNDANESVSIANESNFDFGTSSFTLSGWMKFPDHSGDGFIESFVAKYCGGFSCSPAGIGYAVFLNPNSNSICFGIDDDSAFNPDDSACGGSYGDDQWHHFSAIKNGTTSIRLFVDGVEIASDESISATGSLDNAVPLRFGNKTIQGLGDSAAATGSLDDVRVYNYARTPDQVIEDMNGGHPVGGSPISSQIAYWGFDEQYGTTTNNKNDNLPSLTGTVSGATWLNRDSGDCKINGCLDYDGVDDVTTVANANSIDFDNNLSSGFTMTAWINADSDGENNIGAVFDKGSTYCRIDNQGTTDLDLECNLDLATTDANINITDGLTTNTWHHVALTHDGTSTIEVYIDGMKRGSDTGSGSKSSDVSNLRIGGDTSTNFDGTIDEFKLYSTELTEEQIRIDMNANAAINFGTGNVEADSLIEGTGNPPVGWWKLDENTGTTTYDVSGNNYSLTANGSAAWSPGKLGAATILDGTGDYWATTSSVSNLRITGNLTISAWIYRNSTSTDDNIVYKEDNANRNYAFFINDNDNIVRLTWDSGSYIEVSSSVGLSNPSGKWVHVTVTRDITNNEVTFYENGVQLGAVVNYGANDPATGGAESGTFNIGYSTGDDFHGLIDEVKIYNYERTPAQIAYDFNRGKPVGWWRFDECSGTTANDASGHGNSGIITIGGSGANTSVGTCSSETGTEAWNNGTNGKFNGSLDVDGTDDLITLNSIFDPSASDVFTFSAWINPDNINSLENIMEDGQSNGHAIWKNASGGFYAGSVFGTSGWTTVTSNNSVLTADKWHHIAYTYDGSTQTLYLDGQIVDTNSISETLLTPSGSFYIGDSGSGDPFDGQIDDVRVYNYALSVDQIRINMNHGAVRFGGE